MLKSTGTERYVTRKIDYGRVRFAITRTRRGVNKRVGTRTELGYTEALLG